MRSSTHVSISSDPDRQHLVSSGKDGVPGMKTSISPLTSGLAQWIPITLFAAASIKSSTGSTTCRVETLYILPLTNNESRPLGHQSILPLLLFLRCARPSGHDVTYVSKKFLNLVGSRVALIMTNFNGITFLPPAL